MKLTPTHYAGIALALIVAVYYLKKGRLTTSAEGEKQKRMSRRGGYAIPIRKPSMARQQNFGRNMSSCHSLAFWNNFFNPTNMEAQQLACADRYL